MKAITRLRKIVWAALECPDVTELEIAVQAAKKLLKTSGLRDVIDHEYFLEGFHEWWEDHREWLRSNGFNDNPIFATIVWDFHHKRTPQTQ